MSDKPSDQPSALPQPHDGPAPAGTTPGRKSGFRSLVGYWAEVWADGYAEIVLDVAPQHLNSLGIVHGGVYAALLDAACGHAASWCGVPGNVRRCMTLSLDITYLAPARSGRLVAVGRRSAIDDQRVATLTAEVRGPAGDLHAIAQASFRYERGSERVEGVQRG
jgi:uncharacterized protein (TIGR00369 family)